ncbi:MAG TPA: sigma-70 family RNA polymerase sigma factor, partial [Planctomycetota bacterium]|nr:sigma-70 family RNA polymerase sigma factor [Planctomycetota bacterium]
MMEATLRDSLIKSAFRYQEALQAFAFGLLRDWALAEDVVQDAFIIVMNQWEDYEPGTSLFSWIRQIVHHKAMEARRSRTRQLQLSDGALFARIGAALDRY